MNGSDAQTHLLQSCFEAWCAGRPTLPKEAEGQGCSRILHPNRHKGLTLTLFQNSSACLGCCLQRLWLFTHTALFKLRQFTSSCFLLFYIRSYLQTFPSFVETDAVPQLDQGYPPGVCQHTAVTVFFFCCQSKWNVMSCQENCEAISELSSVRSVTFGVAGSWCLPGALGPNWDLSAKPGKLPRLLSIYFTHCLSHSLFCLFCLPLSLLPHTSPLYSGSLFSFIYTRY